VITPRRTQLVRVPDLHAFRRAITSLTREAQANSERNNLESGTLNPGPIVVVVPTRGAARQLQAMLDGPDLVTRDELYDRLHGRLASPPRRLGAIERDVMAQAAARAAARVGAELSFQLRPGLIAELLRFYDHLRRQSQHVKRFEELIDGALGSDDVDRAAERMRRQTRFLADTFRDYERRVRESDGCDEHTLRERLIAEPAGAPIRHVIVTVADWIADAHGLFAADFDLLTRIPGLATLDIVATEAILGSGFHERLHTWWPGLDEIAGDHAGLEPCATDVKDDVAQAFKPADAARKPRARTVKPVIVTPRGASPDEPWWTFRDREEELVAIARQLKADRRDGDAAPLDRTAVVFKAPLPYLYLAAEIFGAARIPYQATDALPLAAEPTAAALDLVLEAVAANFTRGALVALLRSPHFAFRHDGDEVTRESVAAMDRALSKARYLGDVDRLEALVDAARLGDAQAEPALHAALAAARELAPLALSNPASGQVGLLLTFWLGHLRPIEDDQRFGPRERHSRAAIQETLNALQAVHAAHDDRAWTIDDLGIAVRRAIEDQTLDLESARSGVHLVDDQAARYGEFDDVAIVGVVEPDWPERPRRNIFYPPALLKSLGWPSEKDRRAAADARFLDLLASASRRTFVSTFTLDEDALVSRSIQLDEMSRARLSTVTRAPLEGARIFLDEALSLEPVTLAPLEGEPRAWAELRGRRSASDAPEFHGTIGATTAAAWSVSALETYLDCPFKFFAQHVLKLEEEPDDEEVMDPRRQGQFMHGVFEAFFAAWQDAGHRGITPENLDDARDLFTAVVDRALERLPAAEAGLERTRLLGSSAASGLGEAVFRMEAERPVAVVERLLEHPLRGEFTIATPDGPRTIALRGKADRLDLLADGTFRLIDYKLGWPPQRGRALQLPIYSICAEQRLVSHKGRSWTLSEAAYLAFKGQKRVVPLFTSPGDKAKVLAEAQERLALTIDAIARGEFPPTPDDVWRCETCSFASVCRKDYVGDV
jgi:ATP-dependent helicase/nuclease subunit B